MNEYKADKQTADWLKANGLDEKSFMVFELPYLQAQQAAYFIMKYNAAMLNVEETDLLNNYLIDIKHKAKRHKITKKTVYRVLNLSTKINRQLFKEHKAINKGR